MRTHKQCPICFENKELKEFPSWWSRTKGRCYRPDCRPCWAKKSWQITQEKKLEASPDEYRQCPDENCLFIWHISRGDKCKKCGSVWALGGE